MTDTTSSSEWEGAVGTVTLGATASEGGTRTVSYRIGGDQGLPYTGAPRQGEHQPLIVFEICDDPSIWSPLVKDAVGDLVNDPGDWAAAAEKTYKADMVRLMLTSTRRRGFDDFPSVNRTVEQVLASTGLPLVIEGPSEPPIESEVFQRCGEAGQGERLLLGTAEATRYRSVAAAALTYHHAMIAQSPIDINLAKQLNILLREVGVPADQIVIDPYTGALGYGFEYSYSAMERIRYAALKGDADLAMPMICAAGDTLNVKEIRDAPVGGQDQMAIRWEVYTGLAAAIAGAAVLCVRHPGSVPVLRQALDALWAGQQEVDADGT